MFLFYYFFLKKRRGKDKKKLTFFLLFLVFSQLPTTKNIRIYVDDVAALRKAADIKGLVHVTGGGLPENLPRVLPNKGRDLTIKIKKASWSVPAMFRWMQASGRVADAEMFRTFNMGVGMVAFVASGEVDKAVAAVEGAWVLGEVAAGGDGGVEFV